MFNIPEKIALIAISATALTLPLSSIAEPKYKADVPATLLTPDSAQTKYLGE